MKAFILALAVTAVNECCDPNHPAYMLAAENVELCKAKGGIPIFEIVNDTGLHQFTVLKNCAFPCEQRLLGVEKP